MTCIKRLAREFKTIMRVNRKVYNDNFDRICGERRNDLLLLLIVSLTMCCGVLVVSFVMEAIVGARLFIAVWTALLAAVLLTGMRYSGSTAVLAETYSAGCILIALSASVCRAAGEGMHSALFAMSMLLLGTLLFDRMERKCVVFTVMTVAYIIAVSIGRSSDTIIWNAALSIGAMFMSMAVSGIVQRTKLCYLEAERRSDYEKRHDFLTGLYNRLQLFECIRDSVAGESKPITAMYMIDIDFYKSFNDRYGHEAGDECLRRLGSFCGRYSRMYGIEFYRYGGEEIVAVDFGNPKFAANHAKRILEGVRALGIPHENNPCGVVTVCIGYTTDSSRYEKMIDMADRAMYSAKVSGRNRAVCFEDLD